MLSRYLTQGFFRDPPGQNAGEPRSSTVPLTQRALDLDREPVYMARPGDPLIEPEEVPREEIETRFALAIAISKAGAQARPDNQAASLAPTGSAGPPQTLNGSPALDIAAVELGKVLKLDPEHIESSDDADGSVTGTGPFRAGQKRPGSGPRRSQADVLCKTPRRSSFFFTVRPGGLLAMDSLMKP